jgi:hypothetical protein
MDQTIKMTYKVEDLKNIFMENTSFFKSPHGVIDHQSWDSLRWLNKVEGLKNNFM